MPDEKKKGCELKLVFCITTSPGWLSVAERSWGSSTTPTPSIALMYGTTSITVDLAKSYVVTVEYMEATRVATYSIWILAPVAVCWMWSRPSMSTEVLGRKLKKLWLTCAGTPGTGKIRIQAAMGMITKYTEKRKRDVAYMWIWNALSLMSLRLSGGNQYASLFPLLIGRSRIWLRLRPQFFRHLYCGFAIGF